MTDRPSRALLAVLAAPLLALAASPSHAQERREVPPFRTFGAPAESQDADAVDALLAAFKDAWGRQDVDALMALHAEDVEWINAYARIFRGAGPLGDFLENRLFPAFDPAVSAQEAASFAPVSLRYLGDDAAVAHFYTEGLRGPSRNADEELRRTHVHLVLEEQAAGWRIVHAAIMDAR